MLLCTYFSFSLSYSFQHSSSLCHIHGLLFPFLYLVCCFSLDFYTLMWSESSSYSWCIPYKRDCLGLWIVLQYWHFLVLCLIWSSLDFACLIMSNSLLEFCLLAHANSSLITLVVFSIAVRSFWCHCFVINTIYELLVQSSVIILIFAFGSFYSEAGYPLLSCFLDVSD